MFHFQRIQSTKQWTRIILRENSKTWKMVMHHFSEFVDNQEMVQYHVPRIRKTKNGHATFSENSKNGKVVMYRLE